ncbi:uncharacterized protein LOC128932316 isoform X2 [Callithrix jacchus]
MTCPCSWRPFKDSMGGLTGPVWPVKEASLQLSLWLGSIIQQLLSLHLLQVYDDNDACSPQSGWMGLGQSLSEKLFSRKDPKCSKSSWRARHCFSYISGSLELSSELGIDAQHELF